jgi:PAS domain S-box-containing protein
VQISREKKIFFGALWLYLIGALIFFITFISLDRIYLPRQVWLMFLLLTAGFLLFIFIPMPGKSVPGKASTGKGWYPRTLSQIIEGEAQYQDGLRPPVKTVQPVPLLPLLLLLGTVLLAAPPSVSEEEWYADQTESLTGIYGQAVEDVSRLEDLVVELGAAAAELAEGHLLGEPRAGTETSLFYALDSLAGSIDRRLVPFEEIGIQFFSQRGDLVAWGGRPLFQKSIYVATEEARIFTNRTTLYRLLVSVTPIPGVGRVVVDLPLEVNYRISNRYLRSATLGEILSRRYGAEIRFNFSIGEHGGRMRFHDESIEGDNRRVSIGSGGVVQVQGYATTRAKQPLANITVRGKDMEAAVREREERRGFWAGAAIALAVFIIGIWWYRLQYRGYSAEMPRAWKVLARIGMFGVFLFLCRYLLLELDLPRGFFGSALFDPSVFADAEIPAGLARTPGDFLITSLFVLILSFGTIKIFRTYSPGFLERPFSKRRRLHLAAFKGLLIFLLTAATVRIVSGIVTSVVLNANPRLIGLDVSFLDPYVLVLHMALLFTISAVFIAALFLARLVLQWRDGGLLEGVVSSAIALAGIALLTRFEPLPILGVVGLLVLSIKIFPIINKEDIISVIFSSFFLVLICTLFIYGTAEERYKELRRSRLLERAQDFNYPEDNWLQVVLLDLCQELASDRAVVPKVLSRKESAAFEIWAESSLSGYYLSCVFDVYDAENLLISRFSVGTPYEPPPFDAGTGPAVGDVIVGKAARDTKEGRIHYFKGTAPVMSIHGEQLGRVEISIPYFSENPELLARSGPKAPEILHNIERGAPAPRIDEPEDLLVVRMNGERAVDSSDPNLLSGTIIGEGNDRWFEMELGQKIYSCVIKLRGDGGGFLVGFREAGFLEKLLRWSTIVSLDVIIMVLALFVTLLVRRLPLVGSVTPAISLTGGIGFRQKVLLSFLFVSIVPVVILGAFSSRFIEQRYRREGELEAIEGVRSVSSLISHSILAEAESFAGSQYLKDILGGDTDARIRDVALYEKAQFTLWDEKGGLLLDESMSDFDSSEVASILEASGSGRILYHYDFPYLFGGAAIPVDLENTPGGHLFYRRRLDDEFVDGIADVTGMNVTVYYGGVVRASSQRELFLGGFLDPLLDAVTYATVALHRSKVTVREQRLGEYSFQVASAPLLSLEGGEAAVLSTPLLYQPVLMRQEILRTSALIMGLLALLFAATVTIGIFLAGKIFNPIAALQAGTRRIIEGDLEFKLESDASDELGELVASFNTMTEALREARKRLLERQRYLTAVLDSVATGVITTDGEGRIMTINPSGERILQVGAAGVEGMGSDELKRLGLGTLLELFTGERGPVRESEITIFSGERRRTLKAVVTSLVEGGEHLGTVVVFDDLTELIRSKKLAAWVEMARQIAHEVKNPLTPIRLSAQLMKRARESGREDFDEIFSSGVETVIQQTEILRKIASEFSSFGKASNLTLEEIPVDEFLEGFVSAYRGAEKVRIELESAGGLTCSADREALRKILVNLVENALEAMQQEGLILMRTEAREGMLFISVIDSGPGIPDEIEERLFEPYFSTKTNGTGLGLAISQSLAREMDGEIQIRNRSGTGGVEATLRLPLSRDGDGDG